MKLKHKRHALSGILCFLLAAGIVLWTLAGHGSVRHSIAALLLAALGGINLWFASAPKSLEEEMGIKVDERALFITAQSAHLTLRILNGLLYAGVLLALLGYGFTKSSGCLVVALTLSFIVLFLFIVLLATNLYFERRY